MQPLHRVQVKLVILGFHRLFDLVPAAQALTLAGRGGDVAGLVGLVGGLITGAILPVAVASLVDDKLVVLLL